MRDGFAICLAWPETRCKQAGAWYDSIMRRIGFNRSGYYKVGHAAVVLIESGTNKCHYFDFGRYHAPHGKGRVRSVITDHDLIINTQPDIDRENKIIRNLDEILLELASNKSCHGDGELFASCCPIDFSKAYMEAIRMQKKEFIGYGPFIITGTNCSRFVSQVILKGKPSLIKRFLLKYPATISPTPFWNVIIVGNVFNVIKIKSVAENNTRIKPNEKKKYGKSFITTRA